MSWHTFALTLGLGLLTCRSSAFKVRIEQEAVAASTVQTASEWWYPVSGVLSVYDVNGDLFPEVKTPPEGLIGHDSQPSVNPLSLISESSVETRVKANGATDAQAVVAGSGAGLGQTDGKLAFAGATTAAAKKLAVNASTGNALVANAVKSVKGHAKTADATKGKTPIAAIGWMMWLRATMSIGFLVKSACMICNIFYQASPLPIISEYNTKGDTGEADLAPFIATAYSGWQWCFYGMFAYLVTGKSGFLVLVYSNVVGATLGLYYVYAFNLNCRNKTMIERSSKYYYVLMAVAGVQFIAIMTQQVVRALFFCGLISSAWSTVTSCSLLATVPTVYATRNSKTLPFPLLVMGVISGVLWIVCGVMLWDPWITFPNAFALLVCNYALYLCYLFPARDDGCEGDECYESGADIEGSDTPRLEQSASPLQRALGLVGRSSSSENQLRDDKARTYGATLGGTGGTGDSF